MASLPLTAIIEVSADAEGYLPIELIRGAYCASRCGPIALVLNGVSPQAVDRVLDDVVARSCQVHGVLYCESRGATALVPRLTLHGLAVASSEPLRSELARCRARLLKTGDAVRVLATLSR